MWQKQPPDKCLLPENNSAQASIESCLPRDSLQILNLSFFKERHQITRQNVKNSNLRDNLEEERIFISAANRKNRRQQKGPSHFLPLIRTLGDRQYI